MEGGYDDGRHDQPQGDRAQEQQEQDFRTCPPVDEGGQERQGEGERGRVEEPRGRGEAKLQGPDGGGPASRSRRV